MNQHNVSESEMQDAGNTAGSVQAASWLDNACLILDTETTGLGWGSEIVEISIIDGNSGKVLLETLVKPLRPIPDEVIAIHGITNEMVEAAPTFDAVALQVADIIKDSYIPVVAYNAAFDKKMLASALAHFSPELDHPLTKALTNAHFECAMLAYAAFKGDWNEAYGEFKWHKLENAAKQQGIKLDGSAHRSLFDCQLTRALLLKMAGM